MALLDPGHQSSNLKTGLHLEVVTVGLELCRAYGIRDLEVTYKRMGASIDQKYDCPYSRLSVTSGEQKDLPAIYCTSPKSYTQLEHRSSSKKANN